MPTPRDGDDGLWLSWSLVDTARDRRVGSANSDTDRTNSESSIKAWIAADYLRVAQAEGRAVTGSERADIAAMVRSSDNAAAQRLYEAIGGDAILRHLRSVCGVTVATSTPGYWSLTQITAVDATRIFTCVLRTAPAYPGGDDLLTDLRSVDPDDAFGIKAALPPTTTVVDEERVDAALVDDGGVERELRRGLGRLRARGPHALPGRTARWPTARTSAGT